MYDRALEMGRTAAINEIANEDLRGCELSYVTAIRMLEAVLENDDELHKRRISTSGREDRAAAAAQDPSSDLNSEDQLSVQKGDAPRLPPPYLSLPLPSFPYCVDGTAANKLL